MNTIIIIIIIINHLDAHLMVSATTCLSGAVRTPPPLRGGVRTDPLAGRPATVSPPHRGIYRCVVKRGEIQEVTDTHE